ncbi:MAG: NADH-quinone oxidoreductase subunit NuoF [Desulfocapsaceae bacterium]|nr:NADH-quinone oxidoreductase subunit NuoF [Desulfocapsaceae bacterium]
MNINSFNEVQRRSAESWQALQQSPDPVVYVGMGSCGLASGAGAVWESLQQSYSPKKIQLIKVGCIGPCYLEPFMDIQAHGSPRLSFNNVDPARAEKLIKGYVGREKVKMKPIAHLGDPEQNLDGTRSFWDLPMLKGQERIVLRNCGIVDPENIEHYLARDGFQGLLNSLEKSAEKVIEEIKIAGLRGRGGAGFPAYRKWEFCRNAPGSPKYLICNADEGDPGAFMNRSLIEGDPFALLEGMLIAAYGIGASQGYIYIRAEYPLAIERLRIAMAQMDKLGLLGKDILGSGFDFDITIKEGAGAFVCGEETALIASIEGQRGMPRSRPPFPAISGLHGKPTTIHNVETLATLPNIMRNGGVWYSGFGTEQSKGTKTFSLVGKVRRTGLIEVPLGTTLRQIIFDIGSGTRKPFKAVQTGGPSGGCLSEEHLDLPIDYQSLQDAGTIMGSGGLIVMDEHSCMVDVAQYFLRFTSKESCGKCVPCRIGTRKMVEILENVTAGKANLADLDTLESLAATISKGSLCGLGQTAANPVRTTIQYFRDEYLAHIEENRCPAAVCRDLVEYKVIVDKCTGCQRCVEACPSGAITGPKSEPHNLDKEKCIKCRACYEICRFDAIAGDAIVIE